MKTAALFSAAIVSVLAQWQLPFASNTADQTQPFTAPSPVAIYALAK